MCRASARAARKAAGAMAADSSDLDIGFMQLLWLGQ
jgi:hypothetical protein